MPDTHIALIFDFDDTLVPDSTSQLLEEYGISSDEFWEDEFSPLITEGYDPANASLERDAPAVIHHRGVSVARLPNSRVGVVRILWPATLSASG